MDRPIGAPKNTPHIPFARVLWATSQYLDVPATVWATYSSADRDRSLTKAIKDNVRTKVRNAYRTPHSELGKYVHALAPQHWDQLGIPRPEDTSTPAVTTTVPAPEISNGPGPMSTVTTGVRRTRDLTTATASHRSRKLVRANSTSDMQVDDNPFVPLMHIDEAPTLPAIATDSEYGADANSDDGSEYDRAAVKAVYEHGDLPTNSISLRGHRGVSRAPA